MPTIRDKNIGWLRKEIYLPVQSSTGLSVFTNSGTAPNLTGSMESQESSTSTLSVITGTEFLGGNVTTANDGFDFSGRIPYDLDLKFPVGIRPVYTKDTTGTTHVVSFTWTAKFDGLAAGAKIATASTALSTAIGADTQAKAADTLLIYVGNRGIVNGNTFKNTHLFWVWQVLLTAFTASGNDKMWLLGILLDYQTHQTTGYGNARYMPLRDNPLGETWSYSGG